MAERMEAPQSVKDVLNKYLKAEGKDKMAFDKNWRPPNWDQIKQNIMNETPITFSPSTGYSKDQKDQFMEKSASAVLGALAEVIVSEIKE